jgi:hypothetical protein
VDLSVFDLELSLGVIGAGAVGAQSCGNDHLCRSKDYVILKEPVRSLVIGASYGLLTAAKLSAGGQPVSVVGFPDEVERIRSYGVRISFADGLLLEPPMGYAGIRMVTPEEVDVTEHDLVFLAVQEPQAGTAAIAELLRSIGDRLPVAALMNMPPPPFLERVSGLPQGIAQGVYRDEAVWAGLPAARMTLASPDAQALRLKTDEPGRLTVTLASNLRFAPFARVDDQILLQQVTRAASRVKKPSGYYPVQLLTNSSVFAPLAKWPMLAAGNCRCVGLRQSPLRSIRDAVWDDLQLSRSLYDGVTTALLECGAPPAVLVPFDSYAKAVEQLVRPSSLARALADGATAVERVDLLVLNLLRGTNQDAEICDLMQSVSDTITTILTSNEKWP